MSDETAVDLPPAASHPPFGRLGGPAGELPRPFERRPAF